MHSWIEAADWNIDNDSGGGDGNQYAPEGVDPFAWSNDGHDCTTHGVAADVYGCTDSTACNYNSEANTDDDSCEYPTTNADCNGDCLDGICSCSGWW